ncbi:MAG: hypothetical protein JNM72_12065 [Deltaproteobacteria bacterium]|nr:hypothetical protein [Deltaproteobacteria bacterium]
MESFKIVGRIVIDDGTAPGVAQATQRVESVVGAAQRAGTRAGAALGRGISGGLSSGFAGVGAAAEQLQAVFGDLVGSVGRGVVGGGLAALGLREAAGGIAAMHAEMDTLQAGMATLFSAQLNLPIDDALQRSRGLMHGLAADAAAGVGELADYSTAAARVLSFANAAGKGDEGVRELTRNALAAGMALRGNEGMQTAGFDVAQALSGNVSDQETPIVAAALAAAGVSQKAFTKLDVTARFETLNRAFGRFGAGVALMGKGWDAQLSTFQDGLRQVARLATRPIYDAWLERLRSANTWLAGHSAQLDRVAGLIGGRVLAAWQGVEAVVERVLGRVGGLEGMLSGVERVAGGEGPGWMRGLASGGGMLATFGALVGGASKLGGLAEAFSGAAGLVGGGGATAGAAGGAAAGGLGIGVLAEALAVLAPVAVAIGGAFLAVSGAMGEFPAVTGFVTNAVDTLQERFWPLVAAFGRLNQEGSILNRVGAGLMGLFGVFLHWNGLLLSLATSAVDLVGQAFLAMGQGVDFVAAKVWDLLASLGVANVRGPRAYVPNAADLAALAREEDTPAATKPPVAAKGNVTFTGPVHVEVKAERMDDPDRVAVAFDELLRRADRSRLQARRSVR